MPALAIQPLAATLRAAATLLQPPSAVNLTLLRDDVLQWLQISRTIGEVPPALHLMMCAYIMLLYPCALAALHSSAAHKWMPSSLHGSIISTRKSVGYRRRTSQCSSPKPVCCLQGMQKTPNPPVQRLIWRILEAVDDGLRAVAVSGASTAAGQAGASASPAAVPRTHAAADAAMRELLVGV